MSLFGNFPHVQVGKEPKNRTQHDNMNKNQGKNTAEKEDDAAATKTTAAFTSVCESEWDDYTTEGLAETTTLNGQAYIFGKDDG